MVEKVGQMVENEGQAQTRRNTVAFVEQALNAPHSSQSLFFDSTLPGDGAIVNANRLKPKRLHFFPNCVVATDLLEVIE